MGKKFLKLLKKVIDNTIFKVALYVLGIFVIFLISGVFKDKNSAVYKIISLFSAQETMSIFFVGLLTVGAARFFKWVEAVLEESEKTEDDHHKIIRKYTGHKFKELDTATNYVDKTGVIMGIKHIIPYGRYDLKVKIKDKYSKDSINTKEDLESFRKGNLYLPSVNVCANIEGNMKIAFDDRNEYHLLNDFIMSNAMELLEAHKNSTKSNNSTIRLNDFTYDNGQLTLHTMRSQYYHMLITNRCMDYQFRENVTLRQLYEYRKTITPLEKSKFGNQIGINGLILTSDGYILIEKRDRKKTTWKNKFAQSISLALKEDDIKLEADGTIGDTYEKANEGFKKLIFKTIHSNFGLTPDDLIGFELSDNFMGLARDLLEGGKPNMYFYVTTKWTAKELRKIIRDNAGKTEGDFILDKGKLSSAYYLIPFDFVRVKFDYVLNFCKRDVYKVYRRYSPRYSKLVYCLDKLLFGISMLLKPDLTRECGEALLVTVGYLELCKDRIEAIKNK